jgi:hypothetical protein
MAAQIQTYVKDGESFDHHSVLTAAKIRAWTAQLCGGWRNSLPQIASLVFDGTPLAISEAM